MMTNESAAANHLWRPYTQMLTAPAAMRALVTQGSRIRLSTGKELIDGISSWWSACHGYNHPHIIHAMESQLTSMPHVMLGGLTHTPAEKLATRLAKLLPGNLDHVFLADSGSVSVEVALKMALQYWLNKGVTGRHKFLCFNDAYHGDTVGAMSVCDPEESMHSLFAGLLPEQMITPLPQTEEQRQAFDTLLAENKDRLAGIIIEPLIQGAGGMKIHSPETLKFIRETAKKHDILFIADEIMTGFGRTGRMFACEEAEIVPDIICLGKALTGGTITLAATVATTEVFNSFLSEDPEKALMHGPTFMGNPLACSAANASLDLFDSEPRLAQVAKIEKHLKEALEPCRAIKGVVDVRVKGAIGAVQVESLKDNDWLKARFIEEGVWLRPYGDIVYTAPPFIISAEDLAQLTGAMVHVLKEWEKL